MKNDRKQVSKSFVTKGQFLGFVSNQDENKIKYLRMAIADNEIQIKLSKQARASLFRILEQNSFIGLRPWDFIQVTGEQTLDLTTNELRFKAEQIELLDANHSTQMQPAMNSDCQKVSKTSAKLLVCHRSSCQKRGGKRQHQAIETMLRDRGLHECVTIQKSGCLGKCSQAPNIVLMPGKKRLSGMHPDAIAQLLVNLQSKN